MSLANKVHIRNKEQTLIFYLKIQNTVERKKNNVAI